MALFALACQGTRESSDNAQAADSVNSDSAGTAPLSLKLKWETEPVLTTCESVLFDKDRNAIYVANINGSPDAKDNNGFISKLSPDGKVAELQWVRNLNAPKGMALSGGKLYVADIDRVVEIDVAGARITNAFAVEGAKFLNDVTIDANGRIFVSDTQAGNVIMIENGKLSKWLENVQGGPNGLLAEGDRMMLLTFQGTTVNTVDPATKQITTRTSGIENLDGVEAVGDGGYLVSSWNGMVHYIDRNWQKYMLLDLRADSVNAADIEYIQDQDLLLVPTFFKNTVRAYEVSGQ